MSSRQTTVFITGATDGIGASLARIYDRLGYRLLLTGRRPLASLSESHFGGDTYCQADLAGKGYCEAILEFLHRHRIDAIDICIQNAGTSHYGPTSEQSPASIRQLVNVNLRAPIHLSRALMPYLKRVGGKLVFISSVASYLPCPQYAVYAATKAALNALARSLRVETAGQIRVQVVHPGATRTGMHLKAGIRADQLPVDRFPSAEYVARRIVRLIETGRAESTIGNQNRLLAWLGRHFRGPLESVTRRRTR